MHRGARLLVAACCLGVGLVPALAAQPDRAGQELLKEASDPDALKALLPAFTQTPFLPPLAAEGWGPVMLSPNGKFYLVERTGTSRRSVHLLDGEGALMRGFSSPACPWSSARWGHTDWTFFMECRASAKGKPVHRKVDRVSEKETPSPVPGLGRWSITGADYFIPISASAAAAAGPAAGRYQRYTSANRKTGEPLATVEPAWSPDGKLLAFLTERPRPAELTEAEWPPVRELRVIPARGTVPRVVLSRAAWTKLIEERSWKWASGPESVAWSPKGDALYGVILARTENQELRYLMRMDLKEPRRDLQLVDNTTHVVSTSADGKHWILEMDTGTYRLDFTP